MGLFLNHFFSHICQKFPNNEREFFLKKSIKTFSEVKFTNIAIPLEIPS